MDDTLTCPICGNKMSNLKGTADYYAPYTKRTCNKGMNHILILTVNDWTKKVDHLKLSLNPKYSRFLEIDYVNQKCRINCMKDGKPDYIEVEKMIEPDFPGLTKLKEKVGLYVVFS